MLGTVRKFSSSIFAKVFLFVVAIPFVFWGMGPIFQSGKLNTIVEIGNDKISTQEFVNFLTYQNIDKNLLDENLIRKELYNFIGQKLIGLEIENNNIILSDKSLSKIIKNEKIFKKENKFSRIKYEKYLVENSLGAVAFEANISSGVKKNQLFDFIGGGILPPNFIIESVYDQMNQEREIEIIDLNKIFRNQLNFSNQEIKKYFDSNINLFKKVYKVINFIELNTNNLTASNEFTDLFFEKLDLIDNLIAEGKNFEFLLNQFNLSQASLIKFSRSDIDNKIKINKNFSINLMEKAFSIDDEEKTILIEEDDKYFVIELVKTEEELGKYSDKSVKEKIQKILKKEKIRKLVSEIMSKINNNVFKRNDFIQLSADKNVTIQKIILKNKNDNKVLKQELVNQIYSYPKNEVFAANDLGLTESYLVYVDKIVNKNIDKSDKEYNKYLNLTKTSMMSSLYNTYDSYLKKKYEININFKALDNVNNLFE